MNMEHTLQAYDAFLMNLKRDIENQPNLLLQKKIIQKAMNESECPYLKGKITLLRELIRH